LSYIPSYVTTPTGINAELTKISVAISECLQRNTTSGNQLLVDLDLNGNQVLNLPAASSNTDPVRLLDLNNYVDSSLIPRLIRDYGLGNGYDESIWNSKQDTLVSGTNIKTINGTSLLGSGNIVIAGGGGGGSSVHNDLTDRNAADAHPISSITGLQTALDSKALTSHTHSISDVTGLQTALDSKAATSHTHVIADVTGLQTALDSKASTSVATTGANGLMSSTDKSKLDGIDSGATANSSDATLLARSNHTGTQAISTVTGLQTALDGKQPIDGDLTAIAAITGTGTLQRTGTDTWQVVSNVQRISVGTTAPGDTTMLWLDTN
jgi:hypothetical protein